jgi:hypothetical protein
MHVINFKIKIRMISIQVNKVKTVLINDETRPKNHRREKNYFEVKIYFIN